MSTPTDEAQGCDDCHHGLQLMEDPPRNPGKLHALLADGWAGCPHTLTLSRRCPKCCKPAALTGDEARELAKRWAWWQGVVIDADPHGLFPVAPLASADRERLFTWVRERLAREPTSAGHTREDLAGAVADDLDLWDADGECPLALALIEAAGGWPS